MSADTCERCGALEQLVFIDPGDLSSEAWVCESCRYELEDQHEYQRVGALRYHGLHAEDFL